MEPKRLIDYLPDVLKPFREFQEITGAEQLETDQLRQNIQTVFDNQFISTADADAIVRYEKIYNIVPFAGGTLDDRRFAILVKINSELPYTLRALRNKLDALCGEDGYTFDLDYGNYTVMVKLELTAKYQFNNIKDTLAEMLPANLLIDLDLRYNQWGMVSAKKLKWGNVVNRTWENLKSEVL